MIDFTEYDDRFESSMEVASDEVTISVDKPISKEKLTDLGRLIETSASRLLPESIKFIDSLKHEKGIEYIDDLSDAQIIASEECVSVYWYSAKGEASGNSILGVEFGGSRLQPIDLVLGD